MTHGTTNPARERIQQWLRDPAVRRAVDAARTPTSERTSVTRFQRRTMAATLATSIRS